MESTREQTIYTIVGDNLPTYRELEQCISYSQAIDYIKQGDLSEVSFMLGQGLSEEAIGYLQAKLARRGYSHCLLNSETKLFRFASSAETHKHKKENVLITSPEKLEEDHFVMKLVVDEKGELLQDHLTGFHIQGMVLIEAARQAFLAVTEKYFFPYDLPSSHYVVINRMDTRYQSFVFAVDSDIHYRITNKSIRPERSTFTAAISFHQNGTSCTTVDVEFSVFEASKLASKERKMAVRAIASSHQAHEPKPMVEAV